MVIIRSFLFALSPVPFLGSVWHKVSKNTRTVFASPVRPYVDLAAEKLETTKKDTWHAANMKQLQMVYS